MQGEALSDGERVEIVMKEARSMMPPRIAEEWLYNRRNLVMSCDIEELERRWAIMKADIERVRERGDGRRF